MHELSIASDLLGLVLDAAKPHNLTKISFVGIQIGAATCINKDSLNFGFSTITLDSIAAGCTLEITTVSVKASCQACGWTDTITDTADYVCPACDFFPVYVDGGRELTLMKIQGE